MGEEDTVCKSREGSCSPHGVRRKPASQRSGSLAEGEKDIPGKAWGPREMRTF